MSTHETSMEALHLSAKKAVHAIQSKRVVYIGYPIHNNVGDILIHLGTLRAFQELNVQVVSSYSMDDVGVWDRTLNDFILRGRITQLERDLAACDYVVFHGGGNLGDIWPQDQLMREKLLQRYPDIPAMLLPQSAHFSSSANLDRARRVMEAHRNITLLCRDLKSKELFMDHMPTALSPDMAHFLWNDGTVANCRGQAPYAGSLQQRRRDKEAHESQSGNSGNFDWIDLIPPHERLFGRYLVLFKRISLPCTRLIEERAWNEIEMSWLKRFSAYYAAYDTILTDRLHGLILSTLLSRSVHYSDSVTGKLSQYADLWFSDSTVVSKHTLSLAL